MIIAVDAAKELLFRRRARTNFYDFYARVFEYLNPNIEPKFGWHTGLLCEYAQAVYLGQVRELLVNMPPREAKSLIFSIAFPAWLLGKNPSERILCGSYVQTLTLDLSVKCRRVLESEWYASVFPDTIIAPDQNEKGKYQTTAHGHRTGASVGSGITGQGGHYKILDDPHDPMRANSDKERKEALDWYGSTWASRSDDPKAVREILVMQRLHTDDMTAKWIAEKPNLTKVIIPRVAVERQVITYPISGRVVTRVPGELLNPERVGESELAAQRKSYGTYAFESQQQQEPVPIGGGRIKKDWFKSRYTRLPDKFEQIVQSYDTASKAAQINNPSVCLTFGLASAKWYLVDVWKGRVTSPQLREMVRINSDTWQPTTILIEDKSSGSGLIQDLHADKACKIKPLAIQPHGEKLIRMDNETPKLEAGLVVLPVVDLDLPWLSEFERDLFSFPDCVEWDCIDALSQFLAWGYKPKKSFNFSLSLGDMATQSKWRGDRQ